MRTAAGIFLVALGIGVGAQFQGQLQGQQQQPYTQPFNQPYNQGPPSPPGAPRGAPCGKGLSLCSSDLYCKKVDTGCLDFGGAGGNCIGNCQPRGARGETPYANGAPSVGGPPPPPPPKPSASVPRPVQPVTLPKIGQPSALPKIGQPPAQASGGAGLFGLKGQTIVPITIRLCPSNVRCERRSDVCVPSPRAAEPGKPGWYCVAGDDCGWVGPFNANNKGCPVGSSCLANPKYCDKKDGHCSSAQDGICVSNSLGL